MEYLYWGFLILFFLFVLIGIKDLFGFLVNLRHEEGWLFSVKTSILVLLFILPSIIKDYSPKYYALAVWALIIYSLALLLQRFIITNKPKGG